MQLLIYRCNYSLRIDAPISDQFHDPNARPGVCLACLKSGPCLVLVLPGLVVLGLHQEYVLFAGEEIAWQR